MPKKKKRVSEYIFHIQIQAAQLHKTQPRPAVVPASSRQASPHLPALLASAKPTPKRGHPIPPHAQGSEGANLHSQNRGSGCSPGSPTETMLQLSLPLESQVQPCQCSARAWSHLGGPDWRASLNHRMGSSGRRCGQRRGPPSFLTAPRASLPKLCAPWKTKTAEGRSSVNGL